MRKTPGYLIFFAGPACAVQLTCAIELRDRQGVVFARNYSTTQIGRDLAEYLCSATSPTKNR